MELLEEEEVSIYRNGLEVIWVSLTSVTDTGSKAHAPLSFACTQAELCISLEEWRMEIALVKQTSYACYLSTIKLELCLFLTILLWNWNFCCDCMWLRFCVCWLNGVRVTYQSVQPGRKRSGCTRNWLKREKEIANTHTNTSYLLHLQILLHSWHKISLVKNLKGWQISIKVRNQILWSHKRKSFWNIFNSNEDRYSRLAYRERVAEGQLQGLDDITELYYFIIVRFYRVITTFVYVMDPPYCLGMG